MSIVGPSLSLDAPVWGMENGENANADSWARIRPCLRPELQLEEDQGRSDESSLAGTPGRRWTVFDPISRQVKRIGELEYWFLTRCKGQADLQALYLQFRSEYPANALEWQQCRDMFRMLYANQMFLSATPDQVEAANNTGWIRRLVTSSVSWRMRGVNLDKLLGQWASASDMFFSKTALLSWLLSASIVGSLVLLNFHRFSGFSLIDDFFRSIGTSLSLLLVFVITRALHELGHALCAKRFGVYCPDVGLLFVLGTPCLYCDVSESWRLHARWKRAAVAAAGMYMELILATVAGCVWLFTVDGPWNAVALQVMLVCSVSTIAINANPLMRFDGYYILSDWLDEVQLRQRADEMSLQWLAYWILEAPFRPIAAVHRIKPHLVVFSIAGWLYRFALALTICYLIAMVYQHWNLAWLGKLMAVLLAVSLCLGPVVRFFSALWLRSRSAWHRWRFSILSALLVALLFFLPLPNRQFGDGWVQPKQISWVYASLPGYLEKFEVDSGSHVRAGDSVASVLNQESVSNLRAARWKEASAFTHYENATNLFRQYGINTHVDLWKKKSESAQGEKAAAVQRYTQQIFQAKHDGVFIANRLRKDGQNPTLADILKQSCEPNLVWTDSQLTGAYVTQGTSLGAVCSHDSIAVVRIAAGNLEGILPGAAVKILIRDGSQRVIHAQVRDVQRMDSIQSAWASEHSSYSLGAAGSATPSDSNNAIPEYVALIRLPENVRARPGTSVQASFVLPPKTVLARTVSWIRSNQNLLAD